MTSCVIPRAAALLLQLFIGTIFCAVYLMVQLQARPYLSESDNFLALGSSFSLLMLFVCCIFYKYDTLTASEDIHAKMSLDQRLDYLYSHVLLFFILVGSTVGSLAAAAGLLVQEAVQEAHRLAGVKRLRYVSSDGAVELPVPTPANTTSSRKLNLLPTRTSRTGVRYFHLFLSQYARHCYPHVPDLQTPRPPAGRTASSCLSLQIRTICRLCTRCSAVAQHVGARAE